MVVEAYMGQPFDHSHEKEAVDFLITKMQSRFHSRPECYFLLSNVIVNGSQVDLIILKPKGVIVVELKEVHGPFTATENGDWSCEGRIISTSGQSPYQQVRTYRQKLIDFLTRNLNDITQNKDVMLRQVSSFVCISPSIHKDSKILINFLTMPFFKVVGLDQLISLVDNHISPGLSFDDQAYRRIIKLLGLKPMKESFLSDQFFVPYKKNSFFTGRETELLKIHNLLSSEENKGIPVVISGIDGLGKTQLCVEYAYKFRSHYPNGVYWINASENLIFQFAKIAEGLELRVDDNLPGNPEDILARRFLKMISGTPDALLIFDNVIDFMVFFRPLLNKFSIVSFKCSLLLTSRVLPDSFLEFNQIKLKPFPVEDAYNYVGRIIIPNGKFLEPEQLRAADKPKGQISKLCKLLGNHPLLLNLAANSIKLKKIDLAGYIHRLQVEGMRKTLDSYELKNYDTLIDYSINEMLESHWDGFNKLEKYLLSFFTFFSDEEINSVERLRRFLQPDQDVSPGYSDSLNDALNCLVDLGLVQKTSFDEIIIHPLYKEFCASKIDIVQEETKLILQNLKGIYSNPTKLEALVFTSGVAEIKKDLRICKLKMSSELSTGGYSILEELYQIILQDAKFLIDVSPEDPPGYVKQLIRNRAIKLDYLDIACAYEADLTIKNTPWLCETYNSQKLSGRLVQEYKHDDSPVRSIKLTYDDRLLISGSSLGSICIWDVDSGVLIDDIKTALDIESIQASPNGEYAAVREITGADFQDGDGYVLTFNPKIEIWNLKDKKKVFSKPEDANEVYAVLGDHTVAFGTDHGEMIICKLSEKEELIRVTNQSSRIVNIKVSTSKIAVVYENSVISVLQKSDLKLLNTFVGPIRVYKDVAFLNNDQVLFGCFVNYYDFSYPDFLFNANKYDGSEIGSMVFWDTVNGEMLLEEKFTIENEERILFFRRELSQLGTSSYVTWNKFLLPRFVASSGQDSCLARCGPYFRLFKKDEVGVIEINMEGSKCFGVLNSGDSFFGLDTEAGSGDPFCVMFSDAETNHPLNGHLLGVNEVLATRDEKFLFSASDDGSIKMWDIGAFRAECASLEENNNKLGGSDAANEDFGKIVSFLISGDEKKVAAVTNFGFLIIYSTGTGKLLLRETKVDDSGDLIITSFSESGLVILNNGFDSVITYDIISNEKVKYQRDNGLVNCIHDPQQGLVGLSDARKTLQQIGEEIDLNSIKPRYKVLDIEKNEVLYEVDSLFADIFSTESGGFFISSERPGRICVFDLNSQKLLCELISRHDLDEAIVQFQMNNIGTILSVTYSSGVKEIYNLSTGSCDFSNNYDHPEIKWSFDNNFRLVSVNASDATFLWARHKGVVLAKIPGHNQIQIAGSGRFLVSLDSFGILHFYDCVNL